MVVGIKDAIRDEAIKAFIVLNEGENIKRSRVFQLLRKQYGEIQGSLMEIEPTRRATVQKIIKKI